MKKLLIGFCAVIAGMSAFAGNWRYDNGNITDGDWVISTSSDANGIKIKSVTQNGTQGDEVDLSNVADLPGPIYTVLEKAFVNNKVIRSLKLPSTLTSLGRLAFADCTSLTNVVPFLPNSLTSMAGGVFRSCPIENDLIIANPNFTTIPNTDNGYSSFPGIRSKRIDLSASGITLIGDRAFRDNPRLETLLLPPMLQTIGEVAFHSDTGLKTVVPFLPTNFVSVGSQAFYLCPITNDLVITSPNMTTLTGSNPGVFRGSRFKTVDLSRSVITTLGMRAFRENNALERVLLPETLTSIGEYVFMSDSALKETVFLTYPEFPDNIYRDATANFNSRILYPKANEGWINRIQTDANFKTWDEAGSNQTTYETCFPEGPEPRGYTTFYDRKIWLVPVASAAGNVDLEICAEPEEVGVPSPGYGPHANITSQMQLPIACTNALFAGGATVAYSNVCCRLEKMGDNGRDLVESCPDTLEYSFNPSDDGSYYLTWQWAPVGFTLAVSESPLGAVSANGTTISELSGTGTYYVSNTVVTLTAVQGTGTFRRWFGDVPAGHEKYNPLQITMDRAKSVAPFFEQTVWTRNGQTITDGNWTLNVSGSTSLTITGVKSAVPGVGDLDLAKPISDDSVITVINPDVFKYVTQIERLRLPDTLTTICYKAFLGCNKLVEVVPFLPASLTAIGGGAFYNCPITNDLVISNPGFTIVSGPMDGCATFGGIHSKVIDLSKSGTVTICDRTFRDNPMLETVKFPSTLTAVNEYAFTGDNNVKNFYWMHSTAMTLAVNSFNVPAALNARHFFPKNDPFWDGYLADSCDVKSLGDNEKIDYRTKFHDGQMAKGKVKLPKGSSSYQYYCTWSTKPGLVVIIR